MTSSLHRIPDLRRLATYRSLSDSETMVFFSMLAELGYAYIGNAYDIVCEGCRVKVQIHKDWLVTRSMLQHESGCVFESLLVCLEDEDQGLDSSFSHGVSDPSSVDALNDGTSWTIASSSNLPSTVCVIEPTNSYDEMVPPRLKCEPTSNTLMVPFSLSQQYNNGQDSGCNGNYVHQKSPSRSSTSSGYVSDMVTEDIGENMNAEVQDFRRSGTQDFQSSGRKDFQSHCFVSSTKYVNIQEVKLVDFPELFYPEYLALKSLKDLRQCALPGRECDKNPGHFAYFNAISLTFEQIPTQFRCIEMLNIFKVMSDLTVIIVVSTTSSHRSNGIQHKARVGTGFVIEHSAEVKQSTHTGEKSKFKSFKKLMSIGKKKTVGLVFIQTSRHLVYNEEEAQNTNVEFFYDSPYRKDIVSLEGMYLLNSTTPGDSQCLLVCECSNSEFIQRINQLQQELFDLSERLPLKAKKGMSKKLFMIHHPHGGPKVVSYGDYVTVKYKYESEDDERQPHLTKLTGNIQVGPDVSVYRKTVFYAADTCPGSCGAPLLTFRPRQSGANGDVIFKLDLWMHNGVETSQKLGASVLKGESDSVRCFQCGLGLRSWKEGDDVITEHEKHRPTCPYLQSLPKGQEDNITGAVANLGSGRNSSENMEVRLLETENTIMKKQLTCKVCFKSEIKDVFLPCGELYACSECSKLLTHCPSCKKPILATVTVYLT